MEVVSSDFSCEIPTPVGDWLSYRICNMHADGQSPYVLDLRPSEHYTLKIKELTIPTGMESWPTPWWNLTLPARKGISFHPGKILHDALTGYC
jgi:hypothetical protein